MKKQATLSFRGMSIVLKFGRYKLGYGFSGISGTDFIQPSEIYPITRGIVEEALYDHGRAIKTLTVHVPSNFIRVIDGKIDCDDNFVAVLKAATDGFGLREVVFVAEIQQFGAPDGTLISVNLLDTTVAVIQGKSLLAINTVPIGYSHFVNDLVVVKKIEPEQAEEILSQAVITLDATPKEAYEIRERNFAVREINDIIKSRIEELSEEIIDFLDIRPVHLRGEFDKIYGARNYLAQILGFNVKSIC